MFDAHSSIRGCVIDGDANEQFRLSTLSALSILDTPAEPAFERIVRHAADLFEVDIALVSLIDELRQWFKARCGLDATETPRRLAFCAHAIQQDGVMVVPDAQTDPRFAENPLVTGAPHIRFYAGAPITVSNGARLGTLCVISGTPRAFSDADQRRLVDLAAIVADLIESRFARDFASEALDLATAAHRRLNAAFTEATETLRESVNGVSGYTELARAAIDAPHALSSTLTSLDASVTDLTTVLETAARAAATQAGGYAVTPQSMRPLDVLIGVGEYLRLKAEANNVDLRVDAPEAPIEIRSDAGIVRYLLLNLVCSVIAGGEDDGVVIVRLRPTRSGAEIALTFDGEVGFSAESGLALAQQLAGAVEGRITVATHETGGIVSLLLPDLATA